jgi:hypothetical protein
MQCTFLNHINTADYVDRLRVTRWRVKYHRGMNARGIEALPSPPRCGT